MTIPVTWRFDFLCQKKLEEQSKTGWIGRNVTSRGIHLAAIPISLGITLIDTISGLVPGTSQFHLPTSDSILVRPIVSLIKTINPKANMGEYWEVSNAKYIAAADNPMAKRLNLLPLHLDMTGNPNGTKLRDTDSLFDPPTSLIGPVQKFVRNNGFGAAMQLAESKNPFAKHLISRFVGLLSGVASIVAVIVDAAIGLIAAAFAILTAGYFTSLNKLVVQCLPGTRIIPMLLICTLFTVVGSLSPANLPDPIY